MVDLSSQYERIKGELDAAVFNTIHSTAFINGPEVKQFQTALEKYLGVKHVIPCANGTDALQVALMALDLQPGDEVITSDFTFAATIEVVHLLGLKSVIVDVAPGTFNISIPAIEKAITPRTRAIIPVHLFGQCADLEAILELGKKHKIPIIEDTAQAIGADYTMSDGTKRKAGCFAEIGTTSFFPSKNLGCFGDGGAIFTNRDDLAEVMRSIVNHGMGKRYYYDRIGVNSRLDTLQAAVLNVKLKYLDEYCAKRQAAAKFYDDFFGKIKGVKIPVRNKKSTHVFHQYTLVIEGIDQFKIQEYLHSQGVPMMIYYPVALHSQKAYGAEKYDDKNFPVTNALCKSVISLPMHTELDVEQLNHICNSVKAYLDNNN